MAKAATDFRNSAHFDASRIRTSGRDVGRKVYPKLYEIENIVRIIVHSILAAQLGSDWWTVVADPKLKKDVARRKSAYTGQPWHSTPGRHEVYYIYLSDLTKLLTSNSGLFLPHIPDVDQWTARLEGIRTPRNIVGHMNWLTATDRKRIDVCFDDVGQLAAKLAASSPLKLVVP